MVATTGGIGCLAYNWCEPGASGEIADGVKPDRSPRASRSTPVSSGCSTICKQRTFAPCGARSIDTEDGPLAMAVPIAVRTGKTDAWSKNHPATAVRSRRTGAGESLVTAESSRRSGRSCPTRSGALPVDSAPVPATTRQHAGAARGRSLPPHAPNDVPPGNARDPVRNGARLLRRM